MSLMETSVATASTKLADQEKSLCLNIYSSMSPIFAELPLDILRLVLEASVYQSLLGDSDDDQNDRCQTAYTYCFISKDVRSWVEPILYEKIILESSKQVERFLCTLELKPKEFLARAVKSVWLLDETFPINITYKFEQLFKKCRSMTSLVCRGSSMRILRTTPAAADGSYALRDLTIIKPGAAHYLHIHNLRVEKLHIIDCEGAFLGSLNSAARKDAKLLSALRAMRQVVLDALFIPDNYLTWELRQGFIPLLLLKSPGTDTKVSIRARWCPKRRNQLPQMYFAKDLGIWVAGFDALAQKSGHRLLVTVEEPSDVENEQVNAELDLKNLKLRIGPI